MIAEMTVGAPTLLGEVVTWDVETAEVSFTDLRQALVDAGLGDDCAKELTPRSAFNRACRDLKENRAIDKVESAGGKTKFQFTSKALDGGKVDYQYECAVYLENDTGTITCPESSELETQARDLFEEALRKRNAQDVTRLVQGMFMTHADLIPINPKKGVAYFVPQRFKEFTSKVDDFLRRIGGSLSRFPVPSGTAEGNASVKEAVQANLATVLAELDASVDQWDDKTRPKTIEKIQAEFEKVNYKVEAYAEYLSTEQEGLLVKLGEAKKRLAEKVLSLHADTTEQVEG